MKKRKKRYIKTNLNNKPEVVEQKPEEKEETKMNFFVKHKKGLILGGLGALAAGAAGLFLLNKFSDEDYEEFDDDFFEEDEATSEEAED